MSDGTMSFTTRKTMKKAAIINGELAMCLDDWSAVEYEADQYTDHIDYLLGRVRRLHRDLVEFLEDDSKGSRRLEITRALAEHERVR